MVVVVLVVVMVVDKDTVPSSSFLERSLLVWGVYASTFSSLDASRSSPLSSPYECDNALEDDV